MTFHLRTIDHTADGREIVRDRTVTATRLTVGRAAENDIHLADLAVEPNHAVIIAEPGERVTVEASSTLGFGLDGHTVRHAGIDARTGAELRFGATRILVGLGESGAILLTMEAIREGEDTGSAEKDGLALSSIMPGKRGLAWIVGALIVAIFLVLPIVSNLTRADDPQIGRVVGDISWSPGPLSLAHHQLEGRCVACHVKPFESVRSETCISCHQSVHDHAPPARIAAARSDPGPGGKVLALFAKSFGKEGAGACVDCHREHEGMHRMELPQQQFCTACHGDLKDRLKDTALGNAADFGTLHPQFTVAVSTDPAARSFTRISLDAHPRENSGLAFPHKLHLDPRGGVAKMAATLAGEMGYGTGGLICANCHRPTEDGVRFKPVAMEQDCEACHSLVYDKVGPTFRKLKHGDVDQMIADLSVAGRTTQPIVTGRRRPGDYGADRIYFARFSPSPIGADLVHSALSRDGVCGECHTPSAHGGKPGVVPVVLPTRYMDNGWFDHAAHKQTSCVSCHAAPGSTTSADVLLPRIAQCRTCHSGETSRPILTTNRQVPSGCAMCHAFHPTGAAPLARRELR